MRCREIKNLALQLSLHFLQLLYTFTLSSISLQHQAPTKNGSAARIRSLILKLLTLALKKEKEKALSTNWPLFAYDILNQYQNFRAEVINCSIIGGSKYQASQEQEAVIIPTVTQGTFCPDSALSRVGSTFVAATPPKTGAYTSGQRVTDVHRTTTTFVRYILTRCQTPLSERFK